MVEGRKINGIVLIDHINQLRDQGLARKAAIIKAALNRIRPILMTAGTTVLGLIPLSIGKTLIGKANSNPSRVRLRTDSNDAPGLKRCKRPKSSDVAAAASSTAPLRFIPAPRAVSAVIRSR